MVDISSFMNMFQRALETAFAERVWFVGLQGSYARGEATETSDIDTVVILDEFSPSDIEIYDAMLSSLPHREKMCGFLSGKSDILNWEPSDLFQFYHDTVPICGSLDALLPLLDKSAICRSIHSSVCDVYHGCVHNMLYDKSEEYLVALYKSASFAVQALCYLQTGAYICRQDDLLKAASSRDKIIVETFLLLKSGKTLDFQTTSEDLLLWAKDHINDGMNGE